MTSQQLTLLSQKAYQIRRQIIKMLAPHESHHIGCSLSIVEILAVLYFKVLRIYPKHPNSQDRDIFILSKGHAAAALYATLAEKGFFAKKLLQTYDRDGGLLPEHSTRVVPGIEVSTGSLGHGLSMGVGFALSFKNDNKKNKVYVLISDGELNEGSNWEAIMFACHHKLNNLIVIVDANGYQGYGRTKDVLNLEPYSEKFKAFGWNTIVVEDGNDIGKLYKGFEKIQTPRPYTPTPTILIAKTIKGKGIAYFEGKFESHYKSISQETKEKILSDLSLFI